MVPHQPWRIEVLARGNLFLAIVIPAAGWMNVLGALRAFSATYAGEPMVFTAILGTILGGLHWISGRSIRNAHPRAFLSSLIAGGLTFGYTVFGMLVMATEGRDRLLLILIRHSSENWWDWSFSHFQNSSLREIPLMAWWVFGFGTLGRYRLPGSPQTMTDRFIQIGAMGFFLAVGGAIVRWYQIMSDVMLYSQR